MGTIRAAKASCLLLCLALAAVVLGAGDLARGTARAAGDAPAPGDAAQETVTVSRGEIEAMVRGFLEERIAAAGGDVHIARIRGAREVSLPLGEVTRTFEMPEREELAGSVRVTVAFQVDGLPAGRVPVFARLHRMIEAVTAVRPLARGAVITAGDVALETVPEAEVSAAAFTRVEEAVGNVARKRIDAGAVLRPGMVERPFLVERGDVVTIVASTERIRIATLGEVRNKGRQGDRIRVLNLDSDREVYARVIDAETVGVNF